MIDLHQILDPGKRVQIGNAFAELKDYDTALSMFESALDSNPYDVFALCNKASILNHVKRSHEAYRAIERALLIAPENPQVLGIAGIVAQELPGTDRFDIARGYFQSSLQKEPQNATTLLNYAYMLQVIGDFRGSLDTYTRASKLSVMDMNTRFQRAMAMLTLACSDEEWQEALDEYEIRHLLYGTAKAQRGRPMWTGKEDFQSLVILCEQGIGDAVMMARYARHLKAQRKDVKVYILCRTPAIELMRDVVGIDGAWDAIEDIPEFDYFIPAFSLMRATNYPQVQPSNEPYLSHRPNAFTPLHGKGKMKVGLCWQGNPEHGNDRWRSIGPDLFSDAFAGMPGIEFYSLQQERENKHRPEFVSGLRIETLANMKDAIQEMDLVVTVDTACLHMAGAMGVPTMAAIAVNCDWRWQLNTLRTSWYPSVRLFRAYAPLAWKPVLNRIRTAVDAAAELRSRSYPK